MKLLSTRILLIATVILGLLTTPAIAQEKSIVVSSTTSTEQSGLFSFILPIFKMKSGIDVKVVAVGTGQALDIGKRGDADVVFVHDKPAEEKFVEEGYSTKRYEVMYNDFVLIGPKSDPAKVGGGKDIQAALQKISTAQTPFVSRGDKSGTHAAELRYWKGAGITITLGSSSGTSTVAIAAGGGASTVNIDQGNGGNTVAMAGGNGTNTIQIGHGAGTNTIDIGDSGTGVNTIVIGSTNSTSATTVQSGSGALNITATNVEA
jgi:ABC-type tungstate transport system permease subunit